MSSETARTTRPPGARRLVLGLVAAMLVAGCGSADDAPAANPRGESVTDRGPQLIRVHYTRPLDPEGESGGVEMDVIARGADQSRTKLDLLAEKGRVDETILFIRDGNRALLHNADAETPYTLMEAADEHPEDFPGVEPPGSGQRPASCEPAQARPRRYQDHLGSRSRGLRLHLEGSRRRHGPTGEDLAGQGHANAPRVRPHEGDGVRRRPRDRRKTFSTKPPAGADVHVVKATGKRPPPPDQGEDDPAPEDALATIASKSSIPIYYLGPEFEGMALSDVSVWDVASGSEVPGDTSIDEGQTLYVTYGDDFEMSTTRFVPGQLPQRGRLQPAPTPSRCPDR